MGKALAEVLNGHLARSEWSFKKLAAEAGLPRNTVYRWVRGEVRKVRHWQDLAKAARALGLGMSQANALLGIGGHPPVEVLLERVTDEADRELLSRWSGMSPSNLPAQLTSFVGREKELEQIIRLLAIARLVTLTGTGGSGKTRVALAVAETMLGDFGEVIFVDLASVRDPALVLSAISGAVDLKEALDASPLLALRTYLGDRRVLLVLDNFEHVIDAAPRVTELLQAAPRTKVLVTSRARLHVQGEHTFAVPPLSLPGAAAEFDELRRNPSVALFADRARAVDPSFSLTPHTAGIVAGICTRLEGLPLAIELAAARIRQVRPEAMLERFPDRLTLASGGPRDVPDRQRALRAAIAWSHDLLRGEERTLFACLGVFAGSFSEESAIAAHDGLGEAGPGVAEGLESLAEQNLLQRAWGMDGEPRYRMLETIREFALEQLDARGCRDAVLMSVSGYFVALVERASLEGEGQAAWLHRLADEYDNLRDMLGWCRERQQVETGLRLSVALMPFWQLRDHHIEARAWLDAFMTAADAVPPALKARGLLWQGLHLMRGIGDDVSASRLFEEALLLFRDAGDLDGASETLQAEGDVLRNRGNPGSASERYAESLALAERAGNAYLAAHGEMGLALCAQDEERFEVAQHHWELMLAWAERAGNTASVALALVGLGEMARSRQEWEAAECFYERTLRLARELGNEFRVALALHNLAYVSLNRGDPAKATTLFAESLTLYEDRHYRRGVAECLAGLAKAAVATDQPERAARLCGAAEVILKSLGIRLDTLDRAAFERTVATLRCRLGARLDALLDEGRAMLPEDAVAYATSGPG